MQRPDQRTQSAQRGVTNPQKIDQVRIPLDQVVEHSSGSQQSRASSQSSRCKAVGDREQELSSKQSREKETRIDQNDSGSIKRICTFGQSEMNVSTPKFEAYQPPLASDDDESEAKQCEPARPAPRQGHSSAKHVDLNNFVLDTASDKAIYVNEQKQGESNKSVSSILNEETKADAQPNYEKSHGYADIGPTVPTETSEIMEEANTVERPSPSKKLSRNKTPKKNPRKMVSSTRILSGLAKTTTKARSSNAVSLAQICEQKKSHYQMPRSSCRKLASKSPSKKKSSAKGYFNILKSFTADKFLNHSADVDESSELKKENSALKKKLSEETDKRQKLQDELQSSQAQVAKLERVRQKHKALIDHLEAENHQLESDLARMKETYETAKQILKGAVAVKLEYQAVIQQALKQKSLKKELYKIIKQNQSDQSELQASIQKRLDAPLPKTKREKRRSKSNNERPAKLQHDQFPKSPPKNASIIEPSLPEQSANYLEELSDYCTEPAQEVKMPYLAQWTGDSRKKEATQAVGLQRIPSGKASEVSSTLSNI